MNELIAIVAPLPPVAHCEKGEDFYVAVFTYHCRAFAIPLPPPFPLYVALSRGCSRRGLIYSRRFHIRRVRARRRAIYFMIRLSPASPSAPCPESSFATLHFGTLRNLNIWRARRTWRTEFLKAGLEKFRWGFEWIASFSRETLITQPHCDTPLDRSEHEALYSV